MPKKQLDDRAVEEGRPAKVQRLTNSKMLEEDVAASEDALRAELQKIIDTRDARKLFGVDSSTEDSFSAASAARIRLIKMSHPDRARQHQQALWQLRNEASAHINALWKVFQGSLHTEGSGQSEGTGAADPGEGAGAWIADPSGAQGAQRRSGGAQFAIDLASEQNAACTGRVSTGGAGAGPATKMLQQLWQNGELLRREELQTYIGFGEYRHMQGCVFEPLGTNRAVNLDVVQKRVQKNLESLREKQRYCDFGTISLCVVVGDDMTSNSCAKYYILDGQHRIAVMQSLKELRPDVALWFQLRCKVVYSNQEATQELFSMQDCHPPDPRCFFENREENEMASLLLDFAKIRWPQVFKADKHAVKSFEEKKGSLPKDPARPFLNDGLFFDLIRDFGVLAAILHVYRAEGSQQHRDHSVCAAAGLRRLEKISDAIAGVHELGEIEFGAAATWESCRQKNCFLGMYKYDKDGERLLQQLAASGVIYSRGQDPARCAAGRRGGGGRGGGGSSSSSGGGGEGGGGSGGDGDGDGGGRGGNMSVGIRVGDRARLTGLSRQTDLNGAGV